jgi:hypothetical protein
VKLSTQGKAQPGLEGSGIPGNFEELSRLDENWLTFHTINEKIPYSEFDSTRGI